MNYKWTKKAVLIFSNRSKISIIYIPMTSDVISHLTRETLGQSDGSVDLVLALHITNLSLIPDITYDTLSPQL